MQDVSTFISLCNDIKKSGKELISATVPYMKLLQTRSTTITTSFKTYDIDDNALFEELKKKSSEFISDAKMTVDEIDKFLVPTATGFNINDGCEFLFSVWAGDMYGESGVNGMKELLKELKTKQTLGVAKYNMAYIKENYEEKKPATSTMSTK